MERMRALPPRTPERHNNFFIDSRLITGYLGGLVPEQPAKNLSNEFDLGPYTNFFKEISSVSNIVNIYTDKELEEKFGYESIVEHELLDGLVRQKVAKDREQAQRRRAQGELGSIIYYDGLRSSVTNTKIVLGTYTQTLSGLSELDVQVSEGAAIPLIEMHTHPDTSLFSSADYGRITSKWFGERRGIRGILVCCPDMQIFGLATDKTPLYSLDEYSEQSHQRTEMIRNFYRTNKTDTQIAQDSLSEEIRKRGDEVLVKMQPHLDTLKQMTEQYSLSDEQVLDAIRAIAAQVDPEFKRMLDGNALLRGSVKRDKRRLEDEAHLALANRMSVKLYSSRDFRHFKAFSA